MNSSNKINREVRGQIRGSGSPKGCCLFKWNKQKEMTLIQLARPEAWGMEYIKCSQDKFTAQGFSICGWRGGCCSLPPPRCVPRLCTSLLCGPEPPAGCSRASGGKGCSGSREVRRELSHILQATGAGPGPLPVQPFLHFLEGWSRTTGSTSSACVPKCRALGPRPLGVDLRGQQKPRLNTRATYAP